MKKDFISIEKIGLQHLDTLEMNQISGGDTAYTVGYVVGWVIGYTFGGIVGAVKVVSGMK